MTDTTQGQDAKAGAASPDVDDLFPKQDVDDLFPANYKPPQARQNVSPVQDYLFASSRIPGRALDAFGYGFKQDWGAGQQEMTEADEYMRKAGIWDDYQKGQHSIIRAANEAIMRPAIASLIAIKSAAFGVFAGGQAAVSGVGEEVGAPQLGRDIAAMGEAFPAGMHQPAGIPHVPEPPRPPVASAAGAVDRVLDAEAARQPRPLVDYTMDKIAEAKELNVIGAGEDGYFGTKPVIDETLKGEARATKGGAISAKDWNETLLGQKPEGAAGIPSPVAQPATPVPVPETTLAEAAPPAPLPPIIPQAIVDDVKQKLIAAGRPTDEAELWAQAEAAHYQARAERFQGAIGSAEDIYNREGSVFKSRGRSVEMAQEEESGEEQIAPNIETKMIQAYNAEIPAVEDQYHNWAGRDYSYDILDRNSAEQIFGPYEEDWPPEVRDTILKYGSAVHISGPNGAEVFSPSEAPTRTQHMEDIVNNSDGLMPARSLDDIMSGLRSRTEGAEGAAAAAFKTLAKSYGWSVSKGHRYFDLSRGDTILHVRISDHANLTKSNPNSVVPDINIAPGAHDFNDAAKLLENANEGQELNQLSPEPSWKTTYANTPILAIKDAVESPPPAEGMVRLWRGGGNNPGGKKWVTTSRRQAERYTLPGMAYGEKAGSYLQYVDVPKTDPRVQIPPGHDSLPFEAEPDIADRLRPFYLPKAARPEGRELNQLATAPPFYSSVQRTVENSKQTKASGSQWLSFISNQAGVKPEEMHWLGLDDWLKEQKGSVTKEQVQDFIRANQIEVREVTKQEGGPRPTTRDSDAILDWAEGSGHLADVRGIISDFEEGYTEGRPTAEALEQIGAPDHLLEPFRNFAAGESGPRYTGYRLPGGENYRELLLTLPEKAAAPEALEQEAIARFKERHPDVEWDQAPGYIREGYLKTAAEKNPSAYRSSHWDEPNILAHIRFDDRISDGKKTLHVAEVQSDWHQAGKKKGYQDEATALLKKEDEGTLTSAERDRLYDIIEHGTKGGVPDAPFRTTWPELAMKRVMRYAAENGYDRVSWDTGATNAERYDLRKQISHIDYIKNDYEGKSSYDIHAYDHDNKPVVTKEDLSPQEVADAVGKEVADKIAAGNGKDVLGSDASRYANDAKRLSGLDLKVGGEGMAGFYDKILPAKVGKLVKNFGGKVEEGQVGIGDKEIWQDQNFPGRFMTRDATGTVRSFASQAEAEAAIPKTPVHAVDITPELRDAAVSQGFPLFQQAGVKRGKILLREGKNPIITFFNRTANASTIIHETGHKWLEELMRDAQHALAPQSLKDDAAAVLKWFGVKSAEEIEAKHHEQFANGALQYVMEGKAPNAALARVFAQFQGWLTTIYRTARGIEASVPQGHFRPINDELRGVFDRLITVRPEEANTAPSFADIHEADAEHIPPELAREGAQTIASERDKIAATHAPEEQDARLEGVGNRAERLPAGGEQPGDLGNAAEPATPEEGTATPTGEVGEGGTEAPKEGAKARAGAERLNKAPTPLLRFIAERGGISARDELINDLRQSIGAKNRFIPGMGQLIREPEALSTAARRAGQSGAMTIDRAREAAIEAGLLPEGATITDFLDRMDQELRGHAPPETAHPADPAEIAHAEHNFLEGINDAVKEAGGAELSDTERERALELYRTEGLTDPTEIIERLALEADDTETAAGAPARPEPIPGWDTPIEPRPAPSQGTAAAPGQPAEPGGATARARGEAEKPNTVDPNAPLPRAESKLMDKAGNIRVENLNTPEDVSEVIRQTARDNGGFQDVRGPISDAEVLGLADAAGVDAAYLDTRKLGEAWTAPQIVALRRLLIQTATAVRDAAVKAAEGGEAEIMAYAEAVQRHRMVQERVSSVTAEAGRALRAFQSKFTEGMADAKQISAIVQDATGKTLFQLQEEARLTSALQTPSQVSKAIQEANQTRWQKTRSGILSWFINNLISGPITHAGYSVGNTVTQLFKATVDTSVAAAIGVVRNAPAAERVYFGEVGAQLYGMVRGMRDGFSPAITALQTGVPYMKGDIEGMIGQIEAAHRPQAIPGAIGYVMETPSRAVTAIHTMHYSMNYEAEIARRAYRAAMIDGLEPGSNAFNTKIADFTQRPPKADMEAAHDEAMKMVLMKSAKFGTAQYHLQKAVNSNILAKIVMPFMQVGSNILHEGFIERTPIGLASQTVRDNLMGRNGPIARTTQAARLSVGVGISTAVLGLTAEGILTGGGPSDPKQLAIKEMTGWKPYSIKVGESYVPYRKYLGGLGPLIAGTADTYEVGHALSEEGLTKAAAGAIFGFAEVIADESWAKGLSNFIDAARHWDRDGGRYLRNLSADFIPFSIGLQQITTLSDPYRREVRSMLDVARAHIPGLSRGLFPVRDIWGEPIESHTALGPSQANHDPATQALLDAEYYPAKIERKVRGIDLSDQQYDDLARISGRMARMRVNAMVNSPGFAIMPRELRAEQIRQVITNSREAARSMIMMQNPEIIEQATANKIAKVRGKPAEAQP